MKEIGLSNLVRPVNLQNSVDELGETGLIVDKAD